MAGNFETGAMEVASGVYPFIQAGSATDTGFAIDNDGIVVIDTLMTTTLASTDAGRTRVPRAAWESDRTTA